VFVGKKQPLPHEFSSDEIRAIANYLAINKMPDKLFEYSIEEIQVPIQSDDGSSTTQERKIGQCSEKQRVFQTLTQQPGCVLNQWQDWMTDYKNVWSLMAIFDIEQHDTHNVRCGTQSGEGATIPTVIQTTGSEIRC